MSENSRVTTNRLGNRTLLYILLLLAPLTLLSGCGSGQTGSGQTNSVPVNLAVSFPQQPTSTASASTIGDRVWAVVQRWIPTVSSAWAVGTVSDLASLTVEVSAPDLPLPITKTVSLSAPTSGQVITLTLDIPVGSNRVFIVSCLDRTRVRIFKGNSSPVTLSGGQAATVDIALTATGVAGPLNDARLAHTATLLQNGQVLVVGGFSSTSGGAVALAELFDPATKQWGPLATNFQNFRLEDLLIPGASFTQGDKQFDNFSLSVSAGPVIDPLFPIRISPIPVNGESGFSASGINGVDTPAGETFTSILDYRVTVLDPARNIHGVTGAVNFDGAGGPASLTLQTSLFVDAQHQQSLGTLSVVWSSSPSGSLTLTQDVHQLFVRQSFTEVGPVLGAPFSIDTSFTSAFSPVPEPTPLTLLNPSLNIARQNHTATLLQNGQVLVVGGQNTQLGAISVGPLASAELFDLDTKKWTLLPTGLTTARATHTATLLQNGQVLVVGGFGSTGPLASAELFDPVTKTWTLLPTGLTTGRTDHTATLLQNGQVLVVGGNGGTPGLASAEVFDPTTRTWTLLPTSLTTGRSAHTATLLQNGQVLVVGGFGSTGPLASAELFDPATKTWSPLPTNLTDARDFHQATLLQNGQVLVVGGSGSTGPLASAEVFDPVTSKWTRLATGLTTARSSHTTTLLQNGQVLVSGGDSCSDSCSSASAELYDLSLL